MTSKEKAESLVNKFMLSDINLEFNDGVITYKLAKICALIAVDTMLEDLDDYLDSHYHEERIAYWQEVKQEIEKL